MASYFLSLVALAAYVSAAPQAGQTYTISPAAHPELCVVPSGDWNGARLIITDCDNSDEIAWSFDGQSLKNSATNRCVDVLDGGHWNGNGLQAWDCFEHNTNQRFGTSGGSIQWQDTGMCLDLTDGQSTDGTTLQLWQCFDGNTNQQWTFDEVEEVDDCDGELTCPIFPDPAVLPWCRRAKGRADCRHTDHHRLGCAHHRIVRCPVQLRFARFRRWRGLRRGRR